MKRAKLSGRGRNIDRSETKRHKLSFNNHCLFCLKQQTPQTIHDLISGNPKKIISFQPLLHYITGTDTTYDKSATECKSNSIPIMVNLPPMCPACYEILAELYSLHEQLLQIQCLIQKQTVKIREVVEQTAKTDPVSHFAKFLGRLYTTSSGIPKEQADMVYKFVENLHGKIRAQGTNGVVFPARPPPNFEPQPRPLPPPTVLLQPILLVPNGDAAATTSNNGVAPVPSQNSFVLPNTTLQPTVSTSTAAPITPAQVATSSNSRVTHIPIAPKNRRILPNQTPRPRPIAKASAPVPTSSNAVASAGSQNIFILPTASQVYKSTVAPFIPSPSVQSKITKIKQTEKKKQVRAPSGSKSKEVFRVNILKRSSGNKPQRSEMVTLPRRSQAVDYRIFENENSEDELFDEDNRHDSDSDSIIEEKIIPDDC